MPFQPRTLPLPRTVNTPSLPSAAVTSDRKISDIAPSAVYLRQPGRQMITDDFERWRAEFPILSSTVYMISNSLGAMPRRTADHLAEYARTWAARGVRAWEERW